MTTPIKTPNNFNFKTRAGSAENPQKFRSSSFEVKMRPNNRLELVVDQEQIKHEIRKGAKAAVKEIEAKAKEKQDEAFSYVQQAAQFNSQFEELKATFDSQTSQVNRDFEKTLEKMRKIQKSIKAHCRK